MVDTDYDAELRLYDDVLRRACGVRPRDHVLDVGCGTGQTTRDAARAAVAGSAHGVDISAPAIARARVLSQADGLSNVTFEQADAQHHRFPRGRFDLAISRFGTMFFEHPAVAFANIGGALRSGGHLVMMVWQTHERNEWSVAINGSLTSSARSADNTPAGPDPFSLADPVTVRGILESAGFAAITVTDVHKPVFYGPDVDSALTWVRGFAGTRKALERLDPVGAQRALGRLREMLATHRADDGVWFDSRAWIVTARRSLP